MTPADWAGIVGIAIGQVAAILCALWKFSGWMARIEMKVDEVISRRLDSHDTTLNDHEARLRAGKL